MLLRGEQSFKDDSHTHTQQRLPLYCSSNSVVLDDVLAGFEHLASYQLGTASPVMRWCPGRPQLCIAQWPRVRLRIKLSEGVWAWDELKEYAAHPAAFMADASGCLHASSASSEPIHQLSHRQLSYIAWSPDCRHLLTCGCGGQGPISDATDSSGELTIISFATDEILASAMVSTDRDSSARFTAFVTWLPSSDGIVVSSDVKLHDFAAFQTAGLAVIQLPEPAICSFTGFSADESFMVAEEDLEPSPPDSTFAVMLFSHQKLPACLTFVRRIAADYVLNYVCWVPGCPTLLVHLYYGG